MNVILRGYNQAGNLTFQTNYKLMNRDIIPDLLSMEALERMQSLYPLTTRISVDVTL